MKNGEVHVSHSFTSAFFEGRTRYLLLWTLLTRFVHLPTRLLVVHAVLTALIHTVQYVATSDADKGRGTQGPLKPPSALKKRDPEPQTAPGAPSDRATSVQGPPLKVHMRNLTVRHSEPGRVCMHATISYLYSYVYGVCSCATATTRRIPNINLVTQWYAYADH
jgi:hypothetical protein